MSRLGPRNEYDYFNAFYVFTHFASEAASYLEEVMANFDASTIEAAVEKMHTIENNADMAKHEMLKHLSHAFITPIEREDIVELAQELDTVVDTIEEVLRRIHMFNIKEIRPEIFEFTALIVKCCSSLSLAVEEFKNFKKSKTIAEKLIQVNTIESEGDKLLEESMRRLFAEESDPKQLLIWMTIFDWMENCLDVCEDVADTIESVIMKNT